jgi:hypothetical protein
MFVIYYFLCTYYQSYQYTHTLIEIKSDLKILFIQDNYTLLSSRL